MSNKYVCGCDIGSTYGKAVIMDLDGDIIATAIIRSKLDPEQTAELSVAEAIKNCANSEISDRSVFAYVVGTGYGRNRVEFAGENISEQIVLVEMAKNDPDWEVRKAVVENISEQTIIMESAKYTGKVI